MINPKDIQQIGNLPSAEVNKLALAAGDDGENSVWRNLYNLRLEVQDNYLFWKTRGGSELINSFFGNILTVYPFQSQSSGAIKEYIAVHTAAGKIYIWDVIAETSNEIISAGFSTQMQVQFAANGRFLYVFDYDGGESKYYDLTDNLLSDFLSYSNSYITNNNWLAEGIQNPNIFNFAPGEDIVVFPNNVPDVAGETIYTSSSGGSGSVIPANYKVNSFLYEYNGGQFLKTLDGTEYKQTQFITFPESGAEFNFTVEGSGSTFTISKYYIPVGENGRPSFSSYVAEIDSIDNNIVFFNDPTGIPQTAQIGGQANYTNKNIVFPYNPDLEEIVGIESNRKLNDDNSGVIDNVTYSPPRIFRQYVIFDQLNDGSITITGKPYQVEANADIIHSDGGTAVNLTINAPSENVDKRFLCATRWQPTADAAFDPSTDRYPNSPLFIVGEINTNQIFKKDITTDGKMLRAITERQPLNAGVSDLFQSGSLSPNTIAPFTGSLLLGGYTINRPVPKPYSNPAGTTNGNLFANIIPTTQLPNDMALAFQFEYTDGRRSQIVETEQFLQKGTVSESQPAACDQQKAAAAHEVTAGCSSDGNLLVDYDGVTVTVPLTVANHASPAGVAEAIRQAIVANADISIDPSVPSGGNIIYTEKRYGESFNGGVIDVSPQTTGVTFDTEDPTLSGAVEPESFSAMGFFAARDNNQPSGDSSDWIGAVDGNNTAPFTIDDTDTLNDMIGKLRNAIGTTASITADWNLGAITTYNINGIDYPGFPIIAKVSGSDWNGKEISVNPTSTLGVEYSVSGDNEFWTNSTIGTETAGGDSGCTQAVASIDVNSNNLAGSATEDHTLTIDNNSTAPITINDTDSPEQIVDKYVAEIQATPAIDFEWKAEKVDNSGTWRLLVTYREYGTRGNSRDISVAGAVDVAITVNSPSAGGTQGDTAPAGQSIEVSANRLQVHSLNNIVSKIYVLGRVNDGGITFHLIDDIEITDPGAHGKIIPLPNTEDALNKIEGTVFPAIPPGQILESVELPNYAVVGTPFQQLQISTQKPIVDEATIIRSIPVDFDTDKSTMRYRVMFFTDKNIQLGYLVDSVANNRRVFNGDFEIAFGGMIANSREGISDVLGQIIWTTQDRVYMWPRQGAPQPMFDVRRYGVSDNNNLVDVIYNQKHNELWCIYRDPEIITYDFNTGLTRRMSYGGIGSVRAGAFAGDKLYIAGGTDLLQTDIDGVLTDTAAGDSVVGTAETRHLGNELTQSRLLECTIGGQNFDCTLEIDLQNERFEDDPAVWSGSFQADVDKGNKTLKMHGESFQIHRMAIMPRIRLTVPAVAGGILSHVLLKSVTTENKGIARK